MVTQDEYGTVWFSKTYNTSMRISLYIQGVHKALKIGEFPGYEAEFSG